MPTHRDLLDLLKRSVDIWGATDFHPGSLKANLLADIKAALAAQQAEDEAEAAEGNAGATSTRYPTEAEWEYGRIACRSLYVAYQQRIGKSIWSIGTGVSAGKVVIVAMGTARGLKDLPKEWLGVSVVTREDGPMMMCAEQENDDGL